MHDVGRADELLEQFARQIGQRAGAGRAVGQLARIGPGVGDELLEVARGHGFVDHDRGRRVAENIDSDEILERIVGRVVHDRGNEHLRAGIAEQEGVTIRLCAGDLGGAGYAASAASVLRHHRAEDRLHLLRPQPADDIGGPARRERNHEPDGAIGIGKGAWRRHRGRQHRQAAGQHVASVHGISSQPSRARARRLTKNAGTIDVHVAASIIARNSGVTSGMIPNQA